MGGRIDKSSVAAVTWHAMFGDYTATCIGG